jgi:sugar phosphate isomerase/epimerase
MDDHLALLAEMGCHGLELSPSMIWEEPTSATSSVVARFKRKVSGYGLAIPSIHSLTYSRPDLKFFDSGETRTALVEYIARLAQLANSLECPLMVFGSAKSRQIGSRDRAECFEIMSQVFYQMAVRLEPSGVALLIEPLSKAETDSINNATEAVTLIQTVNHPNFLLHIDLKSSFAEKEDYDQVWSEYIRYIRHCHVANPGLRPPGDDCPDHFAAAKAIKRSQYNGYISIEMGRNFGDTLSTLRESLSFVKRTYLEGTS